MTPITVMPVPIIAVMVMAMSMVVPMSMLMSVSVAVPMSMLMSVSVAVPMSMAVPMSVMSVAVPMSMAVPMSFLSMATMAFGECRRHKHQRGCQSPKRLGIASCRTDRQPNLITCGSAIYSLQQKLKTKGQLQLADHDERRLVSP